MSTSNQLERAVDAVLISEDPASCDYFNVVKQLTECVQNDSKWQESLEKIYKKIHAEIVHNSNVPKTPVKFGTSGWRGILGKDLFCMSVAQVTLAIVQMYDSFSRESSLAKALGVADGEEARNRGCVIGYDSRFCGDVLCKTAVHVLGTYGFKVYFAGETTTGVLSASVMQLNAAFSINFTPSHNPLEYGGLKFNAADAGPAATEITQTITQNANTIIAENRLPSAYAEGIQFSEIDDKVVEVDSFALWEQHVEQNIEAHGLDYKSIIKHFQESTDFRIVVDSVHGASRVHIPRMLKSDGSGKFVHLRNTADVTFGGIAPEPSSENMKETVAALRCSPEKLKLGAIIDPDGDRIRFTDGTAEISMNQFGAMAFHFLHVYKEKRGMVAKTVATSNLANRVAEKLGEEVFEPRVGFKEFKPVIGRALVCFEESDGISIIGHTPEKDAYIGLVLAIDMMLTTGKSLSEYLSEIESTYGYYFPDRDGIAVSCGGDELRDALAKLEKYEKGSFVDIGGEKKQIVNVIDIDGRKMILEDGSWLMIRPSGTEPKVRFYVESRTADGTAALVERAKAMLAEIGLLE